jgi:hypothetical protein
MSINKSSTEYFAKLKYLLIQLILERWGWWRGQKTVKDTKNAEFVSGHCMIQWLLPSTVSQYHDSKYQLLNRNSLTFYGYRLHRSDEKVNNYSINYLRGRSSIICVYNIGVGLKDSQRQLTTKQKRDQYSS